MNVEENNTISGQVALDLLNSGEWAFNDWRDKNRNTVLDLTCLDLSMITLDNFDLSGPGPNTTRKTTVILAGAKLRRLKDTRLWYADLTGADLEGCCCTGTRGGSQDYLCANLTNANLKGADFSFNGLPKAILTGANLCKATFFKSSFSGVQGLEDAKDVGYANWIGAMDLSALQKAVIIRQTLITLEGSWKP
jgi:uncharacterized protein YjbI with pentapeptide repeats